MAFKSGVAVLCPLEIYYLKKQKAAIRIASQVKYSAHTEPLFKSLEILNLPSLIDYFKIQFINQYVRALLPAYQQNSLYQSRGLPSALHSHTIVSPVWREFDQLNPAISLLRDKKEFNYLQSSIVTVYFAPLASPSLPKTSTNIWK
jgi:hypothetical protein